MRHQRKKKLAILGILAAGLIQLAGCIGVGGERVAHPIADEGNNKSAIHPPSSCVIETAKGKANTTYTYNANGQMMSLVTIIDKDNDGSIDVKRTYTTYRNANGRLFSSSEQIDTRNDGSVDYSVATTSTYNTNGHRIVDLAVDETDLNNNGIFDAKEKSTNICKYYYNDKGQVIKQVLEFDDDKNGTFEGKDTSTLSYNSKGQLVARNSTICYPTFWFFCGNGNMTTAFTYSYNDIGRLASNTETFSDLRHVRETHSNKKVTNFTYNDEKQLVSKVSVEDKNNDGTVEIYTTVTYTTDSKNAALNYLPDFSPAGPNHPELGVMDF